MLPRTSHRRPRSRSRSSSLKLAVLFQIALVVVILLYFTSLVSSACNYDACGSIMLRGRSRSLNGTHISRTQYCRNLNGYSQCINAIAKPCRGNIMYHSTKSHIPHWMAEMNCKARGVKDAIKSVENPDNVARRQQRQERRRAQRQQNVSQQLNKEASSELKPNPPVLDHQTASSSKSTFIFYKYNPLIILIVIFVAKYFTLTI